MIVNEEVSLPWQNVVLPQFKVIFLPGNTTKFTYHIHLRFNSIDIPMVAGCRNLMSCIGNVLYFIHHIMLMSLDKNKQINIYPNKNHSP